MEVFILIYSDDFGVPIKPKYPYLRKSENYYLTPINNNHVMDDTIVKKTIVHKTVIAKLINYPFKNISIYSDTFVLIRSKNKSSYSMLAR